MNRHLEGLGKYGEGPFAAAVFGIPAIVIGAVAFAITGDPELAIGVAIGGSLLFVVGLMGYLEASWRSGRASGKPAGTHDRSTSPPVPAYDESDIFRRDLWQCALCGLGIDPDLGWPDARSAAIYHIHPVGIGHPDVAVNALAAHLACVQLMGQQRSDPAEQVTEMGPLNTARAPRRPRA